MARVRLVKPERVEDPEIRAIFDWVTGMEGAVPNHFFRLNLALQTDYD